MPEIRSITLPPAISELPAGSVYARPYEGGPTGEDFGVYVRGLSVHANVQRFPVGGAWTVTVEDFAISTVLATATVTGTQHRAAQTMCGLVAGIALTMGVEPHLPDSIALRAQLAP